MRIVYTRSAKANALTRASRRHMLSICLLEGVIVTAQASRLDWLDLPKLADEQPRTARLFRNGRNQAVRLPKEMELSDTEEVLIYRVGSKLVIEPTRPNWLGLDDFSPASDNFLSERPNLGIDPKDRKA